MAQKFKLAKPKISVSKKLITQSQLDSHSNNSPWSTLRTVFLSIVVGFVSIFLYYGYIETRINTPFISQKVVIKNGIEVPSRYWGTYRPGVYFGTSVRHPLSPVTGLMWFTTGDYQNGIPAIRHWCDQSDSLSSFGWLRHNGRNFGQQKIRDKYANLTTYFIKNERDSYTGEWTARILVESKNAKSKPREVTLIYYVALNDKDANGNLFMDKNRESLEGKSAALGSFKLHVVPKGEIQTPMSFLASKHLGLDQLKETVLKGLRRFQIKSSEESFIGLMGYDFHPDDTNKIPNFIAYQVTGIPPFEIDVIFEPNNGGSTFTLLPRELLSEQIDKRINEFDLEFENKFGLKSKGFKDDEIDFAKAALSNMIGGIGYFYGSSKVQGAHNKEPVPYWNAPLYTAVPSRSFFPRGFLWDEGFHNLLISKWDKEISMDILAHWFDLMNSNGWIPREQILGQESRARVPEEFVVQHESAANPPTLLLTLHSLMTEFAENASDLDLDYLNRLWPRLKMWYHWFNSTQFGSQAGTYRWRGRVPVNSQKELNPKTLTSGLDDYPRSSHPTVDERHVDLRCWMALASGLMAKLATIIEKDASKFQETYKYLSDNVFLDSLHWSYTSNGYMDYGLHTDDVILKRLNPKADKVRISLSDPKLRFVDSFGYVSFFPLFLQILDPQSEKLGKILSDLKRPDLLWTPYGLRSLAKNSAFYNKWNTEHDPPYWRGSIWINMNYLAVRSLKYYSEQEGPYKQLAHEIHRDLRKNVISNLFKQYKLTGYLWEHYNDITGKGEGCRPFTGWSALVVLMMGETY